MSALSNTLTAWTPEMYGTTSPKKLELDRALIQMISNDMQPILIVEDDGFVNFCQVMNPKYLLPSRNVISKTLIPAMFEEVERKLGQKLVQAKWVCFTTDLWTSANTTGFLALTIHFWDHEASALQCFVLDCLRIWGQMRTVLIRNEIISKVVVGVTDNGAIIVKALQNINIKQMACYAHTLNLVANVSLRETPALAAAKETASRLHNWIKNFTAQSLSGLIKHDLSQAVLRNLNRRFGEVEKIKELALATLLDPRFKANGFRDIHLKNGALEILISELVGLYSPTNRDQPPIPAKSSQATSIFSLGAFDKDVAQYEARDTATYPD
eukprot:TCALIF_05529-PA protein Name:"Similar to Zbed4 Zinc finger BED domain-containing protein 4 (Mus musculus)" AED:0.18 eAED:0.25 QI:5/0/0/1/0/0/3/0/325